MRRSNVGLLLTLLFSFSFNGILATALPLYMRERGISIAEIGIIFSAYYIVTQVLRILVGTVSDRVGTRGLIRLSSIGQAITLLIYFLSPFSFFYLIGKVMEGISSSFVRAIDKAIVYGGAIAERRDIGRTAGNYSLYLWSGIGAGSFFAGILIGFGYEYVFGMLLLLSMCFFALSYMEPRKRKESLKGVLGHAFDWRKLGEKLRRITIIRTLEGFAWTLTTSFLLVIVLREFYNLAPEAVGSLLLLIYFMRAAAGYIYSTIAPRVDAKRVFVACTLLTVATSALAAAALAFQTALALFLAAVIANIVLMGIRAPAINKMMVFASNKRELGKEISFALLGYWVGMGFGDAFSGALAQSGGFGLPYALASVAQLLLAWAVWKFI